MWAQREGKEKEMDKQSLSAEAVWFAVSDAVSSPTILRSEPV
jgi:hypothetical protein